MARAEPAGRPAMRHLIIAAVALGAALPATAAPVSTAADAASDTGPGLVQPRLDGRLAGQLAGEVASGLWWAPPRARDKEGSATLADALRAAPGLWLAPAPGDGTRSLGTLHGRARPAILVDGVPLPGQAPIAIGLFDADLLLVQAPAPLDAGPLAAAGLVSVAWRRPAAGRTLAGMGEWAAGGFGSRRLLGRFDLAVAPGVALGIGGHLHHDQGWLANPATGETLNRSQRAGLSATLDLALAPQLDWGLSVMTARTEAGNLPAAACAAPCRQAATARRAAPGFPRPVQWAGIGDDLASQPLGQRGDVTLLASQLAWAPAGLHLRLANSLVSQSGRLALDWGGRGQIVRPALRQHRHSLALDLPMGVVAPWLSARLAGTFHDESERRDGADTRDQPAAVLANRRLAQHRRRAELAGELRIAPAAGIELAGGMSLADERLTLDGQEQGCATGAATPACPTIAARQHRRLVQGDVALRWQPTDTLTAFVRSARTARAAGWNLLDVATQPAALPVETGWHHEAGARAGLAGGRLFISAAGFVATTRAALSPLLGIDPAAPGGGRLFGNRGLDLSVAARPVTGLDVAASLAVQRARWRRIDPARPGDRPLFAPDVVASLSAAWAQPLAGTGAVLVPRAALRWRDAMAVATGDIPGANGGIAPAGWEAAAALQLDIPDPGGGDLGWLVSLECENCLASRLVDGAAGGLPVLNRPRWWQLRLARRF